MYIITSFIIILINRPILFKAHCVYLTIIPFRFLGKPQKSSSLNGRAIKRGRKKYFLWNLFFQRSKISTAIKLEGGGGQALMARPLREEFFCGFPYGRRSSLFCCTLLINYCIIPTTQTCGEYESTFHLQVYS